MERIVGQRQLNADAVKALMESSEHQMDWILGLYRMALPEGHHWSQIDKLHGFPKVSKATTKELFRLAIAFDKEVHPDVCSGGCYMNNGFSDDKDIVTDWLVVWDVEYMPKVEAA